MKLNEDTAILATRILLVPYCSHHVPEYHRWMQNEDLQKATASEPLSLEQEYAMQKSWREDADKLTFIACLPSSRSSSSSAKDHQDPEVHVGDDDADERRVGDVNLFLFEATDDEDENAKSGGAVVGELEIMVARKDMQNLGLGTAILLVFLWYIFTHLDSIMLEYAKSIPSSTTSPPTLQYLRVKIDASNERSIRLFERVGFKKISPMPNYFNELELRFNVPSNKGIVLEVLGLDQEPRMALYRLPKSANADSDTA